MCHILYIRKPKVDSPFFISCYFIFPLVYVCPKLQQLHLVYDKNCSLITEKKNELDRHFVMDFKNCLLMNLNRIQWLVCTVSLKLRLEMSSKISLTNERNSSQQQLQQQLLNFHFVRIPSQVNNKRFFTVYLNPGHTHRISFNCKPATKAYYFLHAYCILPHCTLTSRVKFKNMRSS